MKKFFISTGTTNAKFTLRARDTRYNYKGIEEEYHYHVVTLTTDYETSVEKAQKYLIEHEYDLNELDRGENQSLRKIVHGDPALISFGKYIGKSVYEIYETDKQYLTWLLLNMNKKKNIKTLEIIQELLKDEIEAAIEKEKNRKEKEAQKKELEENRVAKLQYIGKIGEKLELNLIYTGTAYYESNYGHVNLYFFQDGSGNEFVWKTSTWLCDDNQNRPERGQSIVVKATIKDHSEYKGKKQNSLTRLKIVKIG